MRLTFIFFSFLLLCFTAGAQKITGIWRGYFTSSSLAAKDMPEERYKYEVQLEQLSNNSIKGVTYSYKTTVFYGKAAVTGILTMPSRSVIIRETKLMDLRISDKSEPCLMTCYLDYTRIGKLEVLEGTFISVDVTGKRDCGSGKIYLERVNKSDFQKEEFLAKKEPASKPVPKVILPPAPATGNRRDNLAVKPIPGKPNTQQQQNPVVKAAPKNTPAAETKKPQPKPGTVTTKNNPPKKDDAPKGVTAKPEDKKTEVTAAPKEQTTVTQTKPEQQVNRASVPRVLLERENNLVKVISTSEADLVVSLYDNGTIDNDTVSVYHNNELVISNKKLTYSPLTVKIHCTKADPRHEFVMVAENLGDIPPNTAVMVITSPNDGRLRYEITLASNESRNAKVVINFVPKE